MNIQEDVEHPSPNISRNNSPHLLCPTTIQKDHYLPHHTHQPHPLEKHLPNSNSLHPTPTQPVVVQLRRPRQEEFNNPSLLYDFQQITPPPKFLNTATQKHNLN